MAYYACTPPDIRLAFHRVCIARTYGVFSREGTRKYTEFSNVSRTRTDSGNRNKNTHGNYPRELSLVIRSFTVT